MFVSVPCRGLTQLYVCVCTLPRINPALCMCLYDAAARINLALCLCLYHAVVRINPAVCLCLHHAADLPNCMFVSVSCRGLTQLYVCVCILPRITQLYVCVCTMPRINPSVCVCLYHAASRISNVICRGLFHVYWFEVRGYCLFCWYWWNCWPSLFKISFH